MKSRTLTLFTLSSILALGTTLRAVEYVVDDFSFGPAVRGRESVAPGTFLGGQTTSVGNAQWETTPEERGGHSNLHFVFTDENGGDDKGAVTYPDRSVSSSYFAFDFPMGEGTVTAYVDFIANESFPRGGGIWIGFTADSPTYLELIDSKADHIALRFNPDARNQDAPRLSYQCNISGNDSTKTTNSALRQWKPDQVTRLTLSYDAKSKQFVGKVELLHQTDVEPLLISGTLESETIFNHIQFEMTGQDAISTAVRKGVFRKIEASVKK